MFAVALLFRSYFMKKETKETGRANALSSSYLLQTQCTHTYLLYIGSLTIAAVVLASYAPYVAQGLQVASPAL